VLAACHFPAFPTYQVVDSRLFPLNTFSPTMPPLKEETLRQMSIKDVSQNDRIIVVMGPTGAGKSTFIECATRQDDRTIGRGLRSFTEDIRIVRTIHPNDGRPILFADTPGFDDTSKSDVEILILIADFLVKIYKEKANLASVIYLHKISDNRMTGSLLKNLQTFASLCGHKAMPNVVIATTMWGKVGREEGTEREAELKREFWREMMADGCRTERFENTYESAWHIIGNISPQKDSGALLRIQKEMSDADRPLNRTRAGIYANKPTQKVSRKGLRSKFRRFFSW